MLSGDQNFVSGDLFTGVHVSRQKATWVKIQLGALPTLYVLLDI